MITPVFISIVIPTLNEEKFLPLLLADLAKQSYADFEVLVVDAQSEDKTIARCQKFANSFSLKVITSQRRNVSTQRNAGAQQAKGSWIIFMDADDRLPDYFLQGIKYQLEKHPRIDVFTCWLEANAYDGPDKPLIELTNIGLEIYSKIKPVAPGALIGASRAVIEKNRFDETLKHGEDHHFVSESIKLGFTFKILREPRFFTSLRRFKREGTLKVIRKYAQMNLQYALGKPIPGLNPEYLMTGGSDYDEPTTEQISWFEQIRVRFSRLSKKQKDKLIEMIGSIDL